MANKMPAQKKVFVLMQNDSVLAAYTDKAVADEVCAKLKIKFPTTERMLFFNVYEIPLNPDKVGPTGHY